MQNWFIVKNVITLCNQSEHTNYGSDYSVTYIQYYYRSEILCRYFSKECAKVLKAASKKLSFSNVSEVAVCISFYKIGVHKTSAKSLGKHICRSPFKKVVNVLAWNFKLKTVSRIFFIFLNEFCKNVKNNFLLDSSRQLLLIFRKPDIQTFNSKQIRSLDQYCRDAIFDE